MNEQVFLNGMKCSFNLREPKSLRPTNIYMVCRINNKQIKLATNVKVFPEQWNKSRCFAYVSCKLTKLENDNNTLVNEKLESMKGRFELFKDYIYEHPEAIAECLDALKRFVYIKEGDQLSVTEWIKNYISARPIAESSKARYLSELNILVQYATEMKLVLKSFKEIDYKFVKSYEEYLLNRPVKIGSPKTLTVGTVKNKMQVLLDWLKEADRNNLFDWRSSRINDYKLPVDKEDCDNEIYLTESEIERIYHLSLVGREEQIRDAFILQCWTGQRYSDIIRFADGIIKTVANGKIIELIQKKTSISLTIPLLEIAREILVKYNNKIPTYHNHIANYHLKEIAQQAEIYGEVLVKEHRKNGVVVTKKQKWELVTTHTARRSFATNMLLKGYTAEMIMKVTGHKTMDAFKLYMKATSSDVSKIFLADEAMRNFL